MEIWILTEGEPLPIDGENVRLRRMGQLSKILISRGHTVRWFSSNFDHYNKIARAQKGTVINYEKNFYLHLLDGVEYKNNVSFNRILHHVKIAKKFKKESKNLLKPDILIATMAPLEFSEVGIKYANSLNIPCVVDIRDLWPEIYFEVVPERFHPLLKYYVNYSKRKLKKTLKNTTNLIAVTEGFLQYGLDIVGREKKENDRVFYTSYKQPINSETPLNSKWKDIGLSEKDFIVSFVGNFGIQFNLDPLFEVAKNLDSYNNIKFVFCGEGERFAHYLEKNKKQNNVIMSGWVNQTDLNSLLSNTSVGIAPYRDSINFRLNIPNKFGEYLSYGLPIMLSVEGSMLDLCNEYNCGAYYRNSYELEQHLLSLYSNKDKMKKISQNAKILFEEQFNSGKTYNLFADYLELIGGNN